MSGKVFVEDESVLRDFDHIFHSSFITAAVTFITCRAQTQNVSLEPIQPPESQESCQG